MREIKRRQSSSKPVISSKKASSSEIADDTPKNAEIKVTGDAKNNTTSTIITYIKQSHCLFRLYMLKYRLFDNFLRQTDIALGFFYYLCEVFLKLKQ